jgi:hypothetical protein
LGASSHENTPILFDLTVRGPLFCSYAVPEVAQAIARTRGGRIRRTVSKRKGVPHPEHSNIVYFFSASSPSRWVECSGENYMTNRERLQLINIKVKVIKYPREKYAIFGKNEIVKILLRKARGEKVKYTAA